MRKRTLFGAVLIVLLLVVGLLGFVTLENRELDKWAEPAESGQFIMAIRVDGGNWQEIDDAKNQVHSLLPESQAGDGHFGIYQKWRGSGFCRISRRITNDISLQELADMSGKLIAKYAASYSINGDCQVCVIDSSGRIYLPKE